MFLVGAMSGPPHHVFYKFLDKLIPKATTSAVIKKIGWDQLFFSPVCIFLFFYGAGLIEGRKISECTEEMRQKFMTVYKVSVIAIAVVELTVWMGILFSNGEFFTAIFTDGLDSLAGGTVY